MQEVDVAKVAALASRGHAPEYQADIEHYAKFVSKFAGGEKGELLRSLDRFVKSLPHVRTIVPEFYSSVSKVSMTEAPLYVVAMVKANLAAPDKFVIGERARVFSQSDLDGLQRAKRPLALKAHAVMQKAREFVATCGIDPEEGDVERIVGICDVRLVMQVHDKVSPGRRTFASSHEVGCAFYADMLKQFGDEVSKHASPWVVVPLATAAAKKPVVRAALREAILTQGALEGQGFKVGVCVVRACDEKACEIARFGAGIVALQPEHGEDEFTVSFGCLQDTYAVKVTGEEDTYADT